MIYEFSKETIIPIKILNTSITSKSFFLLLWNLSLPPLLSPGTPFPNPFCYHRLVCTLWKKGLITQLCLTLCNYLDHVVQPPVFLEFHRQEYWSRLSFPSLEDLPNTGIEPGSPDCRWILYHMRHQGIPLHVVEFSINKIIVHNFFQLALSGNMILRFISLWYL